MTKLNLGSGDIEIPGYRNLDIKHGEAIFPLPVDSNSVDEIRASHVLEHFSHRETAGVLADWVRALKPGGVLKVAVPNFDVIAREYLAKSAVPIQGYTMGGQVDEHDQHRAIFNVDTLATLMRKSGLVSINGWRSEAADCAALPVSLNLMGWKRPEQWPAVHALMSVPRLGFMDSFFCWWEALAPLRIPLQKYTGAFWGQCLERGFEQVLRENPGERRPEYLLTIDYDTIFDVQDLEDMLMVMVNNPGIDALAPVQSARSKNHSMFVVRGEDGKNVSQIPADYFFPPASKVHTAHFGCTLIRAAALADLPKPWFHSRPGADGSWNEGRVDDDIWFWERFAQAGKQLYLANRVAVGHLELMIRWPGDNETMAPIFQHHNDYAENGTPEGVWQ